MSEHEIPENVSGSEEEQAASAQPAEPVGRWPKPKHTSPALEKLGVDPLVNVVWSNGIEKVGIDPLVHTGPVPDPMPIPNAVGGAKAIPAVLTVPYPVAVDTEDNQAEPAQPEQEPDKKGTVEVEGDDMETLIGYRDLIEDALNRSVSMGQVLLGMTSLNAELIQRKLREDKNPLDGIDDGRIALGIMSISRLLLDFMGAAVQTDKTYTPYQAQARLTLESIINSMLERENRGKLDMGS